MNIYIFVGIGYYPVVYVTRAYNDVHAISRLREHLEKDDGVLRDTGRLITFDFPNGRVESYMISKINEKDLKGVVKL